MRYYVTWAGRERAVELRPAGDGLVAIVDGVEHPVDVASTEAGDLLNLIVGGASYTYGCRFEDGHAVLSFHDREVRVQIEDDRERQTRLLTGGGRGGATGAKVRSSMPGVVKELRVAVGDTVAAGAPLLILEAMKMENEIRAPVPGRVAAVHVTAGAAVEKGVALVDIEAPEDA
ncbi:MAG: acetyl-CoA carboxylase biotin carboxyl carrier protein subunit [Planctomycetota bacterium]